MVPDPDPVAPHAQPAPEALHKSEPPSAELGLLRCLGPGLIEARALHAGAGTGDHHSGGILAVLTEGTSAKSIEPKLNGWA